MKKEENVFNAEETKLLAKTLTRLHQNSVKIMKQEEKTLEIIKTLQESIASDKKYGSEDGNSASWGYEQGVLLTRNETKEIVRILKTTLIKK